MGSLKKFLTGLFSSSAVVGFVFIYYYCYHIINYVPDGVSFGNSLAILGIVLRVFIPVAVGVIVASYFSLIDDYSKLTNKPQTKIYRFVVLFCGCIIVSYVNAFLNAGFLTVKLTFLLWAQGAVLTLLSLAMWLGLVYFPHSFLGRNVLNLSATTTAAVRYRVYRTFHFLAVLLVFFLFYFITYVFLGWGGVNKFVEHSMEMAGLRKVNVELLLKKDSEEIVSLSCAECDRQVPSLTKTNKNNKEATFVATLKNVEILWGTGDKHYIRFCDNDGGYAFAELPKDGYTIRFPRGPGNHAKAVQCTKNGKKEDKPLGAPVTMPPSDVPKPVVDAPAIDKQPMIVINNYNVPVQAITSQEPKKRKPQPLVKKPPKPPVDQCPEISPRH
jgi:hypothetical protein